MHRHRALFRELGTFFAVRSWAGCITNMFGFDLRQAQAISQLRMSSGAALFAGGVVALTLAEYVVHRFVLHGFAPTEHRLHHANPDGAVLKIFWQIWICFALIYLIAGGAFVAGALVAYAWYLFVHLCAHQLPLLILKHHQSHHKFATRNYGVSTTLWDHVFGTILR